MPQGRHEPVRLRVPQKGRSPEAVIVAMERQDHKAIMLQWKGRPVMSDSPPGLLHLKVGMMQCGINNG